MIFGMLGDEERAIQQETSRHFPAWDTAELPAPPPFGLRNWTALIGPGLVLAGSNIGGGEWLFGPIVTARYGGQVMWLATLSILFQVFYNLAVMRYTLYTGEPIMVGFMRTKPGPKLWAPFYVLADMGGVWPYLASNAAVPLAAAFLGRLPDAGDDSLVRNLGYGVFLTAFVPLIFGGKIYNAIERLMVTKIVLVLGYLSFIGLFMAEQLALHQRTDQRSRIHGKKLLVRQRRDGMDRPRDEFLADAALSGDEHGRRIVVQFSNGSQDALDPRGTADQSKVVGRVVEQQVLLHGRLLMRSSVMSSRRFSMPPVITKYLL